jgi:hypothetical protein
LSANQSREIFEEEFVPLYNDGKLPVYFYEEGRFTIFTSFIQKTENIFRKGGISIEDKQATLHTQHQ